MVIGIDATNIRSGGGLTHLKEVLQHSNPEKYGFSKVIIWSNNKTLSKLPAPPWLEKETHPWLNKSFIFSFVFQIVLLSKKAKSKNCKLLFVPGGSFLGNFKPIVSMSQNMLPFEKEEYSRYSSLNSRNRFRILKFTQSATFRKSEAVIFLTEYARSKISESISLETKSTIIPHGINTTFSQSPKVQFEISNFSRKNPFKLLYVSIITVYKHQWNVASAVLRLRKEGYPITLDLVGALTEPSTTNLNSVLAQDTEKCVHVKGLVPYESLGEIYKTADAFVFASSCENMPIILIEAMTSGLPIASSDKGPMPEVLGDGGIYFNPLNEDSVYTALKEMIESTERRKEISHISYRKSMNYTWRDCSDKTFRYLAEVLKVYRGA